jgi:predicted transcriptional regulator
VWRRVAEAQVKASHAKLSAKAKELGFDPNDHVLIVTDWDGTACKALDVEAPDKEAAVIVAGRDGKVLGVASGKDVAEQVVKLLE